MKPLTLGILIAVSMCISACSNRQVYDAVQNNRRLECDKMPDSAAREECLKQYSESYDSYQRERDEMLEEQQKKKQSPTY